MTSPRWEHTRLRELRQSFNGASTCSRSNCMPRNACRMRTTIEEVRCCSRRLLSFQCATDDRRQNTNHWHAGLVGKNTSFSLDEHYSAFIDREVVAGRYRSASDVVRSASRLLEDRETQLRTLREALEAGERGCPSTPFDFDAFLARKRGQESPGR